MDNANINIVFIGLGSNEGDRINYLISAVKEISKLKSCTLEAVSSLYESVPLDKSNQNNFINAVIKITTEFDFLDLLSQLKEIEKKLGRIKREQWGPREIDLDILFFNDLIFSNEIITLPHEGVIYRDFVLVPLCEIQPDFCHPVFHKRICDFIIDLKVKNIIKKISNSLITEEKTS